MVTDPLRVLVTADPELPVPPRLYGGIERVIALLVEGLHARGHDVRLVAHVDSTAPVPTAPYPCAHHRGFAGIQNAAAIVGACRRWQPQVVHSFGRLASVLPAALAGIPVVMSYQRAITPRSVAWSRRVAGRRLSFTACSDRMLDSVRHLAAWRVVYNAVDTARFLPTVTVPEDAPLVFLGRIESIKGPHLAIQIAREAGRRLVIAGNVPAEAQDYFDREIAPHIDGRAVSYAGAVDDAAKGLLLSSARALLMPILWDEPFGIVMAEALACGTPVLGLSRGSVPEVVEDGVTGFSRGTTAELVETVAPAARLDRRACRRAAETRFSQAPMVDAYLAVYEEAIASTAGRRVPIAVDHAPSVGSGGAP